MINGTFVKLRIATTQHLVLVFDLINSTLVLSSKVFKNKIALMFNERAYKRMQWQ